MKSSYSMVPSRSPSPLVFGVVVVDHQRLHLGEAQRVLHHLGELAVGDQHFGLGVIELERDHRRIEPRVDGVEHGVAHRHAVMALQHGGRVGEHDRHGVAAPDAALAQCRGETARAGIEVAVAAPQRSMHDGDPVGKHRGGALQERQRRQRLEIGRVTVEIGLVGRRHGVPRVRGYSVRRNAIGASAKILYCCERGLVLSVLVEQLDRAFAQRARAAGPSPG